LPELLATGDEQLSGCRAAPDVGERIMSDKFESLDANEKAAVESTLYRCRALVGRIREELRKKKPEHFVDERSPCRLSRLP
jgi:hypothetical protein